MNFKKRDGIQPVLRSLIRIADQVPFCLVTASSVPTAHWYRVTALESGRRRMRAPAPLIFATWARAAGTACVGA